MVKSIAGSGRISCMSKRSSSAKVTAIEAALSATTAPQPPASKANASRSCDSHSLAIHGWPRKVCEWLSMVGTEPCSCIHLPTAMCQCVSGSDSSARLEIPRSATNNSTPMASGHETCQAAGVFPRDESPARPTRLKAGMSARIAAAVARSGCMSFSHLSGHRWTERFAIRGSRGDLKGRGRAVGPAASSDAVQIVARRRNRFNPA